MAPDPLINANHTAMPTTETRILTMKMTLHEIDEAAIWIIISLVWFTVFLHLADHRLSVVEQPPLCLLDPA